MVIAAYGAMAIWCRKPALDWIALVPDGALDVGQAVPAAALRPVCTLRAGPSRPAQTDLARTEGSPCDELIVAGEISQ